MAPAEIRRRRRRTGKPERTVGGCRRLPDCPKAPVTLGELGSNGEDECCELPVGIDIKTACGPFADRWERIALQSETPPVIESDSFDL
ncbi:hypothetical protein ACC808_33270 [Rhizobium ruizarguesonis]|jgi:hypothetical protein|uniref:hypothetical protein n=1 Tax=Rhizobium ruizarguesonis TaxID=2081791 RepID=UPI0019534AD0|nr:hypothetical protein [Rhizobium ruizarguesonis]